MSKSKNWGQTLFWLYGAVMLWLLFGQRLGAVAPGAAYWERLRANLNVMPLHTIRNFLYVIRRSSDRYLIRFAAVNLVGNVVLFVPLGIFLPMLYPRLQKPWRFLLCLIPMILAVELTQLVTLLGSCDVDDLILNVSGALLGLGLFHAARFLRRALQERRAP